MLFETTKLTWQDEHVIFDLQDNFLEPICHIGQIYEYLLAWEKKISLPSKKLKSTP